MSRPARPVVSAVETFPLESALPDGGYGTAKAPGDRRVATLVKVTTSDGVHGWGESFGPPRRVAPFLAEFGAALLGQPVAVRENRLLDTLSTGYHHTTGGPHVAALSGLDIALWDAQARTFGVPVGDLLGGRLRESVAAYASSGYVTPGRDLGELRAVLARNAAEGFRAVKIKIGLSPAEDRARTQVAREVFGDTGLVMVDYNTNATAASARRSIERLHDLDPYWVEEPVPPHDHAGYRELRAAATARALPPLAGGEALYTRYGFREPIAGRQLDIVQPDVAKCGGFTEAQAIRAMAAAWNLRLSPHCWGTGVAQAATLQLLSAVPDVPYGAGTGEPLIFEFDRGHNPLREGVLTDPIRPAAGGRAEIPSGPGLGVSVDEAWVRAHRLEEHSVAVRR
ncbi:mandelate racemase/muconate lactonizing enzyme family protein [Streptomyces xiamenensis]|uniref:mandelate racemase/muconate lactonizing enzyme family protein n=1 Tax=Streptomyces TaxID=1883 RepID=UPI000AC30B48|nr:MULTISPECIES: mandelate racemase/muconate lactonizing enzyme family protein [Streptomyces]